MKTAVVVLATGEYWRGAKVLFHTLSTCGGLPDHVDRIVLGVEPCDWATALPVLANYSWVPVSEKNFPRVADKFFALTLPYDRIVLMDADVMCVGNCSYLWSDRLGSLPFYACRDTASELYYPAAIREIGLNPDLLFNAGVMVFQGVDVSDILSRIASGGLRAYDGGDQGYLNHYFQQVRPGCAGWLPPEYDCCMDVNMPQVPDHAKRLVHFCGGNANPWNYHSLLEDDFRMLLYRMWDAEWKECDR